MTKMSLPLFAAALAASPIAHAGVTFNNSATPGASWTGSPAVSILAPNAGTMAQTLSANTVMGQTFTAPSAFKLGAVSFVGNSGPGIGASVHLLQLNSTYTPASGGYVPATASTGVDLLGGGAGLSFTFTGSSDKRIITLDFTGSDEVNLQSGKIYALEIWTSAGSVFLDRGGEAYAGGSVYQVTDPAAQSATSTVSRNNVGGGTRDAVFAAYAAPVPEPASMVALGLGAAALVRRRKG